MKGREEGKGVGEERCRGEEGGDEGRGKGEEQ